MAIQTFEEIEVYAGFKYEASLSTSLLSYALTIAPNHIAFGSLSGNTYAGNDLPDSGYNTSTFYINCRGANSISVYLTPDDTSLSPQLNKYTGAWSGWQSIGGDNKFIKGQAIPFYDTDGETLINSVLPENLVYYDGESGEEIANNIIWAQPSANVTFGTSYAAPNLIAKNTKGNGFEISNGAIKCNKNGKIQVNAVADVFRSSSANDDCYIAICKNDTNVSIGTTTFQIYTRNLSTIAVIDVVEGDVITFKVKANSVTGSILYTSSDIICEYVEDYYITQAISESNTYSTDEVVIGRWIDGKPIYRKVVSFSMTAASSWTNVAHGISNLDTVINYYGMVHATDGNWDKIPQFRTGGYGVTIYVGSSNIAYTNDWLSGTTSAFLIIEYTKTTD